MLRILSFLFLILLLFPLSASQGLIYTGNIDPSSEFIKVQDGGIEGFYPNFSSENATLNISVVERDIHGLEVYRSYYLNASNANQIVLEIVLQHQGFENWTQRKDFEYEEYQIITGNRAVINLNETNGMYKGNIAIPSNSSVIYIAGTEDFYRGYQTAVNPDLNFCSRYWRPPENYIRVDNCKEQLDQGFNLPNLDWIDILKTLGSLTLVLLSVLIYQRKKREDRREKEIEEMTTEIIDKMESGQLGSDKEMLQKLENINEKAYNGKYGEASKLLKEVKNELRTKSEETIEI